MDSSFSPSPNPKRKVDEKDPDAKKLKAQLEEAAAYSTSDEWPIYCHPEGGIVKITPWGSLRQYQHPVTGQQVTKFEDLSFQDHSFNQAAELYMPSTPQSMCPQASDTPSPSPENMRFGSETEQYVVDGYLHQQPPLQQEYHQEHENYFGMDAQEDEIDQENLGNADQMMM